MIRVTYRVSSGGEEVREKKFKKGVKWGHNGVGYVIRNDKGDMLAEFPEDVVYCLEIVEE